MKTKRTIKKTISVVMTLIIAVSGFRLDITKINIYGSENMKSETNNVNVDVSKNIDEQPEVVKELKSERTENSNTYLMSDGSKKLEIANEDIRYKENGKWKDYDPTIKQTTENDKKNIDDVVKNNEDYDYVNKSGDSKQYFADKLDGKSGIVMTKGDYAFSFIPITEDKLVGKMSDNEIKYENDTNVEYKYESLQNGVKECIVLRKCPSNNQFVFKLNLNGMKGALDQKSGDVIIKSAKKEIARISAPNLIDADNNVDYKNVKYSLDGNVLTIEVDKKYLNDSKTKYPVTIDPSAMWTNNCLSTAVVDSMMYISDNNIHMDILRISNKCRTNPPFIGTQERAYVNFDLSDAFLGDVESISGKYIANATFRVFEATCNYGEPTIELRSPQSRWNAGTITWNNQPKMGEKVWGSFKCNGKEGNQHIVDITDWAQSVADGKIENTGFVISAKESKTGANLYGNTFKYGASDGNGHGLAYNMYIAIDYFDIDPYDNLVKIKGEYNVDNNAIHLEAEQTNGSEGDATIKGYKIYKRNKEQNNFEPIINGNDIKNIKDIDLQNVSQGFDLRVAVLFSNDTVKLSNIISFEKENYEATDNNSNKNNYVATKFDTDGDGLEDGYEIWDFKTLWNTKSEDSTEANVKYQQDSDGDGLPDGYEVFTLGTDPAVKNEDGKDSDGDGWTDVVEYQKGTNPLVKDSDFDGINDSNEVDTNPKKTDNVNINGTDKDVAANTNIHIGLYEREYSKNKKGVTYNYVENIYSNQLKQVKIGYGDNLSDKTIKYFYDTNGNVDAIVEQYDEKNDPEHKQTKCITYTYGNDNITFICDNNTKYEMLYEQGILKKFKIDDVEIESKQSVTDIDKTSQTDQLKDGDLVKSFSNTTDYGNNQKISIKTEMYKVSEDDFDSVASKVYIYYNDETDPDYELQYNAEGKILKFTDYTANRRWPTYYEYASEDGKTTVKRSDGFIRSVTKKEETDEKTKEHKSTTSFAYTYKDLKGNTNKKESSIVSTQDKDDLSTVVNFYDEGKYTRHKNDRVITDKYFQQVNDENPIMNVTQVVQNATNIKRVVNSYGMTSDGDPYESDLDYNLDKSGNILNVENNGTVFKKMEYDSFGRLKEENYARAYKNFAYEYDDLGNVTSRTTHILNKVTEIKSTENFEYKDEKWPNRLTDYEKDGKKTEITYDEIGNPKDYIDGKKLQWERGRKLKKIENNGERAEYKYNENGQRRYKTVVTKESTMGNVTNYEWDENKLIMERNTDIDKDKTYDIWYLYNENDEMIGYDYVTKDENKNIKSSRVFFEKDLEGTVIGLWSESGYPFASILYDCWGNVVKYNCASDFNEIFKANHIGYKSYYFDDESGFYYDGQNDYYVPQLGQNLNMKESNQIIEQEKGIITEDLYYGDYIKSKDSSIIFPMEQKGYKVDYDVDKYVSYCDTQSLFFESMGLYNTNCYGFAINCWTYRDNHHSILPGLFIKNNTIDYSKYANSKQLAQYVKKDMISLGEDAIILEGEDNNPYYKTDDKHSLIAVRAMDEKPFYSLKDGDYCHFMLRKDDGWYFKSGWNVGIFKLKGNNTPDTVPWTQYKLNAQGKVEYVWANGMALYTDKTQYIVVPKMSIFIKE